MDKEKSKNNLLKALPYFQIAVEEAKAQGQVKLGILSVKPDGGGQIILQFECEEFFNDLSLFLDASPPTEQDRLNFKAMQFRDELGIK